MGVLLSICMAVTSIQGTVLAEETAVEMAEDNSVDLSGFTNTLKSLSVYGSICNSYLSKTDTGYQAVLVDTKIHILDFDSQWRQISEKLLDYELPIFGGYFSGEKYNYVIAGQKGSAEGTEIYRVIKYDKEFNRIASLSVPYEDCYTSIPFDAGNVSVAESGNKLTIYTARQRPDGHQSNIALRVNTDAMTIDNVYGMDAYPDIHVSHSFRQIVEYDGETPVYVDLGDSYPRAVSLQEKPGQCVTMLEIGGQQGDNVTDTDVSGMAVTDTGYLVVGTQMNNYCNNIYLSYVEKGADTAKVTWLTASTVYQYSDVCNAKIVKAGDGVYAVMWNSYSNGGKVDYVMVNNQGELISRQKSLDGAELTQCEPVFSDGKVTWLKYEDGKREVYTLV
ncbi:MAG: hypothetical protein SOY12_05945 [Schaedlerella sp.]|nr:hypothetical protein [Schaedlerella sp.]